MDKFAKFRVAKPKKRPEEMPKKKATEEDQKKSVEKPLAAVTTTTTTTQKTTMAPPQAVVKSRDRSASNASDSEKSCVFLRPFMIVFQARMDADSVRGKISRPESDESRGYRSLLLESVVVVESEFVFPKREFVFFESKFL